MKIKPIATRKRRLRKKLRVDDFQELGFDIEIEFIDDLNPEQWDRFVDDFIDEVELNKLLYGGPLTFGFLTSCKVPVTEFHQQIIRQWLLSRSEVRNVFIGPLIDAWYPESDHTKS